MCAGARKYAVMAASVFFPVDTERYLAGSRCAIALLAPLLDEPAGGRGVRLSAARDPPRPWLSVCSLNRSDRVDARRDRRSVRSFADAAGLDALVGVRDGRGNHLADGDPTPSAGDIALTRRLARALHLRCDTCLLDHLVIAARCRHQLSRGASVLSAGPTALQTSDPAAITSSSVARFDVRTSYPTPKPLQGPPGSHHVMS